jgi:hypothetical protein
MAAGTAVELQIASSDLSKQAGQLSGEMTTFVACQSGVGANAGGGSN